MRRGKRWAVLISGTGSNLSALLDVRPTIDIGLIISNTEQAYGLTRARRAGVPTLVLGKPIDWKGLLQDLRLYGIEGIFLLGFMRIVPAEFISGFWGPILNLHPSLLPSYPGLHSIQKAFEDASPLGCTVHHVVPEVDAGPHLLQRQCESTADLETSEFLVHISEQRLVRKAVTQC